MKQKKLSIKTNYIFNLIATLVTLLAPFITTPYVSRVFNASLLGTNSYISTVSTIFVIVSTFGFYIFGQREISKYWDDKEKISSIFFSVFICRLALTFLCSCLYLIVFFLSDKNVLYIIYLFSIVHVAFDCGFLFAGLQKFKFISIVSIAVRIISCVSIFIFIKSVDDIWIYAVITVFNIIASSIIIFIFSFKEIKFIKPTMGELKYTFMGSLKLFLPTIAISIFTLFDKLLIQWLSFGTSIITVNGVETSVSNASLESGFYVQADSIISICLTIIYSLQSVMISKNAEEIKKGNIDCVFRNMYKSNQFISFITVPMTIGLLVIAPCFCTVFFGDGYDKCSVLIQIASISFIFSGFHSMIGNHYLIASEKERIYTIALFSGGFVNIILNLILIPFHGAIGAMIATIIGKFLISLLTYMFTKKEINYSSYFFNYLKCLIPSGIMGSVLIFEWLFIFKKIPSISSLLVLVLSGVLIYLCVTTMMKGNILKEEWNKYFPKLQKYLREDED